MTIGGEGTKEEIKGTNKERLDTVQPLGKIRDYVKVE